MKFIKIEVFFRLILILLLSLALGGVAVQAQAQPPARVAQKPVQGQEGKPPEAKPLPQLNPDARYDYQGEATFILQSLPSFHSPYEGANSFGSQTETELTHSYALYLGAWLVKNFRGLYQPGTSAGSGRE